MKVFAHSAKDTYLIMMSIVQIALTVLGALSLGHIPLWATLLLGAACVYLHCTNYQCTAHNFLHNPFFASKFLNQVFSLINSLGIGLSQALYRCHHMHHHKYNNDDIDPKTGTTLDQTSTYRFSKVPGKEENVFLYTFGSFFRQDTGFLIGEARRHRVMGVVIFETLVVLAYWAALGFLSWRGFVFFALPVWYLGQSAAYWENYMEHHGAIPGNRMTDSVSCYSPFYNFVWFNNGYHQEHHYRPQVHWTQIHTLRDKLPPETERRVVRGAHWFNFNPPQRSSYVSSASNVSSVSSVSRPKQDAA